VEEDLRKRADRWRPWVYSTRDTLSVRLPGEYGVARSRLALWQGNLHVILVLSMGHQSVSSDAPISRAPPEVR